MTTPEKRKHDAQQAFLIKPRPKLRNLSNNGKLYDDRAVKPAIEDAGSATKDGALIDAKPLTVDETPQARAGGNTDTADAESTATKDVPAAPSGELPKRRDFVDLLRAKCRCLRGESPAAGRARQTGHSRAYLVLPQSGISDRLAPESARATLPPILLSRDVLFMLFVSVTMSCARSDSSGIELIFDPCEPVRLEVSTLTPEELASVERAVTMWNEAVGSVLITSGESEQQVPILFEDASPMFHGQYEPTTGAVYINKRLAGEYPRAITIAHELGHAFGLDHVSRDEHLSLMNRGNLEQELTSEDREEIRRLWGDCTARSPETSN